MGSAFPTSALWPTRVRASGAPSRRGPPHPEELWGASRSKAQLCRLLSQREPGQQESSPLGGMSPGFVPASRDRKAIIKLWKTKTLKPSQKEAGALCRGGVVVVAFWLYHTACGAARSDRSVSSSTRDGTYIPSRGSVEPR